MDKNYQGYKVEITESDLDIIKEITSRRGKAQREEDGKMVRRPTNFFDPDTMDIMEYTGVIGEYGFSKFYNLQPPYVSDDRLLSGDRGYDYAVKHLPTGDIYTIEVKSTGHEDGNLLARKNESIDADIYMLCIVDNSHVYIIGGVDNSVVKSAEMIEKNMAEPCRLVAREELSPPPDKDELEYISESEIKMISMGEIKNKVVRTGDVIDVEDAFKIRIEEIY